MRVYINFRFVLITTLLVLFCFCVLFTAIVYFISLVYPTILPQHTTNIATASVAVIGFLSTLLGELLGLPVREIISLLKRNRNVDIVHDFPFYIVTDIGKIASLLMPDSGNRSPSELPYQHRVSGKDISVELKNCLFENRRILLLGISGLGKSREISRLLPNLIDEGFTVLIARKDASLDTRVKFPERLSRRLLFVFEDMQLRCADFASTQRGLAPERDFLDEINSFLERAESVYSPKEVYAIFTATKDIDSLQQIQHANHPIWQTAESIELSYPDINSQMKFVLEVAHLLQMSISEDLAHQIAELNEDKTYENLAQNLFRHESWNQELTPESFTPWQRQTWEQRYKKLIDEHPSQISALFDAFNLLKHINLPMDSHLVIEVAVQFMSQKKRGVFRWLYRPFFRRKIISVVNNLKIESILGLNRSENTFFIHERLLMARPINQTSLDRVLPFLERHFTRTLRYSLDVKLILADYFINQRGFLKSGITILTSILRNNPLHVKARSMRAHALSTTSYLNIALEDANIALEIDPENPQLFQLRGLIHLCSGQLHLAEHDLNSSISLAPNEHYTYKLLAELFVKLRNHEAAKTSIDKAISIRSDYAPYYVYRARIHVALDEEDLANQDLSIARQVQPQWASVYSNIAGFYLDNQQYALAKIEAEKALEIAPHSSQAHYVKAWVAFEWKEYDVAKSSIEKAIQTDPFQAPYYFLKGKLAKKQRLYNDAFTAISHAILLNGNNARYYGLRAQITTDIGIKRFFLRYTMADFQKARKLDPSNSWAILFSSHFLVTNGNVNEGLQALKHTTTPVDDPDDFHHIKAHIYSAAGNNQLALENFNKAIELAPDNPQFYICRAIHFVENNKINIAKKEFALAINNFPNSAKLHRIYIQTMLDKGNVNIALRKFYSESRKQKDNAEIAAAYAYGCALANKKSEAEQTILRSLELNISDPDVYLTYMFTLNLLSRKFRLKIMPKYTRWFVNLENEAIQDIWHLQIEQTNNLGFFVKLFSFHKLRLIVNLKQVLLLSEYLANLLVQGKFIREKELRI